MEPDDSVGPDPEILDDREGDEEPRDGEPFPEPADGPRSRALVPVGDRGLAPYDPFRRYMAEISKYPPLDREEEQRRARL